MKLLLDHNLDQRLWKHLPGHEVVSTQRMKWDRLVNGNLLRTAAAGGFDVLLTNDKAMEFDQNLSRLPLPIILFDLHRNFLPAIIQVLPSVLKLLATPLTPAMYVVTPDGSIDRITAPRR